MNLADYDLSISGTDKSVMMKVTFRHGLGDVFGRFVAITATEGGLLFSKADGPRTGYTVKHARENIQITHIMMPRSTRTGYILSQLKGHYRKLHKFEYSNIWKLNTDEKESGAC